MYKIGFFLGLIFSVNLLMAQSISGNVTDATSHQGLSGASIYFPQLKLGAVCDIHGHYTLSPLPKGTYNVEMHMTGYAIIAQKVIIDGNVIRRLCRHNFRYGP